MKLVKAIFIISLIYFFHLFLVAKAYAIIQPGECSAACDGVIHPVIYIQTNSISNEQITYSETQKKFTIKYSYIGEDRIPSNSSICGVFGQKSDPNQPYDEVPIIACKRIDISAGQNNASVDFSLDSNEPVTAGIYTLRITDKGINGPQIVEYNTNTNTTPLPTASPTPEPGEDCIGQFQSFSYAGTCCNPNEKTGIFNGKTLPYCDGYKCEAIQSDYLLDENFVCKDEKGWVQPIVYEQDNDEIRKAIDQATQDCGRVGIQCCLPKLLDPPTIDHWWFRRVLNPMMDFISNLVGIKSMVGDIESEINSATEGTICKETGTIPELTYTDESKEKVDNVFFTGNEKDGEDSHYQFTPLKINSYDQCIAGGGNEDQCRRQSLTPTIIPLTPTTIPESKVKSCTCVSVEGDSDNRYAPDAALPRNISEDEIKNQICFANQNCLDCISKNGSYWQSWLDSGKGMCVPDENKAIQNLDKLINNINTPTPNPSATSRLGVSAVLAGEADVDTYVKGCQSLSNPLRQLCKACRLDRGFWGVWGCADSYVDVGHMINLCKNFDNSSENGACLNCTSSGRMWTAIGCVEFSLQGIIQEQIIGWGIGLAGISAILCIIYSALILQTSANNPEKIKQAQDMMTACITGLVVIIFAVFILNVIGVDILRIPGFQRG